MSTLNVENIRTDSIDKIVNENSGLLIVECYKFSKGPLFIMEPILNKLRESRKVELKQFRVDLVENATFEEKYQIVVVPCYLVFMKHQLVDKIYGVNAFYEYITRILEQD